MVRNYLWDMTGKFGNQVISLVLSFILTRLLSPEDFGVAGIAMVIYFFSSIFLDLGFSRALVQKQNAGQSEFSSVFFLNLGLGIFFTVICFITADPLANYFGLYKLDQVLKTLSILFFINSLSLVPISILTREMKFRSLAIVSLISAVISGSVGIILAYQGYGVWSLVAQYLVAAVLSTIISFIFSGWKPLLLISKTALQPLWVYGSRMFSANLVSSIVSRVDVIIIGRLFNAASLGYYTRAQSIDSAVKTFSSGSLTSVFFPSAAKWQHDRATLAGIYRRYLHLISFLAIGVTGLLYLLTPDLFTWLFTEKWNTAALYFQLMCIGGIVWPMSALMVCLVSAVGNSKAFLRLELLRIAILLPVFVFGLANSITTFLWLLVAARVVSLMLNCFFVSKEIPVRVIEQAGIIFRYLLRGLFATGLTWIVMDYSTIHNLILRMILISVIYFSIYMASQFLMKTYALKQLIMYYRNFKAPA